MKKLIFGIVVIICALFLTQSATATASDYLQDNTKTLYANEVGRYCIYYQSTGQNTKTEQATVTVGGEMILNLEEFEREYIIPPGTVSDDFPVCMELMLPSDATLGVKYPITYTDKTIYLTLAETSGACTTKAYKQCYSGDVWWYDSCGNTDEIYQVCDAKEVCGTNECENFEGSWLEKMWYNFMAWINDLIRGFK